MVGVSFDPYQLFILAYGRIIQYNRLCTRFDLVQFMVVIYRPISFTGNREKNQATAFLK